MTSNLENQKQKIITEFIETRQKFLELIDSLPLEKKPIHFLGIWSVKELLAHLQGWDWANMNAIRSVLRMNLPEFYDHYDIDWRTYNAELVKRYQCNKLSESIKEVRQSHQALIQRLLTLSADDMFKDFNLQFKGSHVTIAKLIQAEIGDEKVHTQQLKSFLES